MNNRAYSIDLLRALAIIGMVLSGQIAANPDLPAWLFHAQTPPPGFGFDPSVPGITWVDLVFPFFLFSMGAAFPLSLGRKLDAGAAPWSVGLSILKRGLLLAFFAIVLGNTGLWLLNGSLGNLPLSALLSLVVWCGFFAAFIRMRSLTARANDYLNRFGLAALVGVLVLYKLLGVPVQIGQSDIIILVLANVVVAGSLIWWWTRRNIVLRLAVVAVVAALKITSSVDGSWSQMLWEWSPAPWLYRMEFLKYLCIVLPGSIVGDLIAAWLRRDPARDVLRNPRSAYVAAGLVTVVVVGNVWGLFVRELVANLVLTLLLGGVVGWLLRNGTSATERLLRRLFGTGMCWLVLGLILETLEGGIKKDPATLSYFFVMVGLASFVVLASTLLLRRSTCGAGFLLRCGENPMVAYTLAGYVVVPLLILIASVVPMPWLLGTTGCVMAVGRGVIITGLMMCLTALCTRLKLFWRT